MDCWAGSLTKYAQMWLNWKPLSIRESLFSIKEPSNCALWSRDRQLLGYLNTILIWYDSNWSLDLGSLSSMFHISMKFSKPRTKLTYITQNKNNTNDSYHLLCAKYHVRHSIIITTPWNRCQCLPLTMESTETGQGTKAVFKLLSDSTAWPTSNSNNNNTLVCTENYPHRFTYYLISSSQKQFALLLLVVSPFWKWNKTRLSKIA